MLKVQANLAYIDKQISSNFTVRTLTYYNSRTQRLHVTVMPMHSKKNKEQKSSWNSM